MHESLSALQARSTADDDRTIAAANRGRLDHRGVSSDYTIALRATPAGRMLEAVEANLLATELPSAEGAAWSVPTGPTSPPTSAPQRLRVLVRAAPTAGRITLRRTAS